MDCEDWQGAISAEVDGEDPGVDTRLLSAHVAQCARCSNFLDGISSQWSQPLHEAFTMPDLSSRIVKANAVADRARVWWIVRALLLLIAGFVIFDASHDIFFGAHGESAHAAKHLGAFTFAYGVGLAVVAVRPARARTMLPVTFVLGAALFITAVLDVVDHETPLLGETVHIPELLSVLLVWLLLLPTDRAPVWRRNRGAIRPAPRLVAVDAPDSAGDPRDQRADRS